MGIQNRTEQDEFFDRFYEKEFPKMRKYALAILEDPFIAEEVVQDAFVEVLQNIDKLMTHEKPEHCLRKVVKAKACHRQRDQVQDMRWLVFLDARNADSIPEPDKLWKAETSENVLEYKRRITRELPQKELRFLMHFLRKNKTYKNLAKETGCSIASCQRRIQEIRTKLASIFSKE